MLELSWAGSKPVSLNKVNFALNDKTILHHQSDLGEFFLSSDSIGHTYGGGPTGYKVKSVSHILDQVPPDEIERFFNVCCTIGAYIIFPSKRIDNKPTINGAIN